MFVLRVLRLLLQRLVLFCLLTLDPGLPVLRWGVRMHDLPVGVVFAEWGVLPQGRGQWVVDRSARDLDAGHHRRIKYLL